MKVPFRPFRFCVNTGGAATKQEWIDRACKAEDFGYDALLFSDHIFIPMSPAPAIAAAAMATTRLRFGSYMFGNDFRHPLLLAQDAASLDVLSDGRFDLGLGTGYLNIDYNHLGIPLDPPITRINRLEEATKIIKGYLAGQPFDFQGKYYQVKVSIINTVSVQKPNPPILMGGGGKRMLSLAAREADIVSLNVLTTREGWFDFTSISPEATEQKLKWVHETAGERDTRIELSILVPILKVTEQESEILEAVKEFRQIFNVSDEQVPFNRLIESPHVLLGSLSAIEEKIQANREKYGISHYVFFEPLEKSTQIVKRLAGQ